MPGNSYCKQVCAINVDSPDLSHSVNWIIDRLEVLGETCRGDETVDLAVLLDNLSDSRIDTLFRGDIGIVCCDKWCPDFDISGYSVTNDCISCTSLLQGSLF